MKDKAFEMELGGETYRPTLDMNAIICVRRETGQSHEVLLERIGHPDTDMFDRVDALRTLVWAMIATDCTIRLRRPHPAITEVGNWFEADPTNVGGQIVKFLFGKGSPKKPGDLAPFVPTPVPVVRKMIELAEIAANDQVVDLGAGDGRIMVAAVESKDGVRATGYEFDEGRFKVIEKTIAEHPKAADLFAYFADIRTAKLDHIDVVFLYLLNTSNAELKPKLLTEMKPGARVVSHDFEMPDWEPENMATVKVAGKTHRVYMWRIPE